MSCDVNIYIICTDLNFFSSQELRFYQKAQMLALNAEGVGQIGTSYHQQEGNQVYQPALQCQVLQEAPNISAQK